MSAAAPAGVWIVTGVSASGKTTVAHLLADRLERSVLVQGDTLAAMVRNGHAGMTPEPTPEALRQLELRYAAAAAIAATYAAAGFAVVLEDVILGPLLQPFLNRVATRPRRLVVLAPSAAAVAARERAREKDGYRSFTLEQLDRLLRQETPRLGLWLDTSAQSPAETVEEIVGREREART